MKKHIIILTILVLLFANLSEITVYAKECNVYGNKIKFSVTVADCTEKGNDGKIRVEIKNPKKGSLYLVSFDKERKKFYTMPKNKLMLTKASSGTHYISVVKKNDISTLSETVTVNVGKKGVAYPIEISTENTVDKIFKDGRIQLYIDNYDKSKKYEWSIDGGKSWRKMSGGTISIIECKGGIYKTVVREKGKSGYRSPTLDVFVEGAVTGQNAYIPTEMIMQNPELPTGCEITSLTILLRHIGYDADKLDMADNYLPKGEYRASDFKEVFVGNPRSTYAYGCFSKPIVKAAEKYLDEYDKEDKWKVRNITGCTPESLYAAVDNGYPPIVWASIDLNKIRTGRTWVVRDTGETVVWPANEHCLLLVGYDMSKGVVYINDPLRGIMTYSKERFETRFYQLEQHAIIIVPN